MAATKTAIEHMGRAIIVEVDETLVSMRRFGERDRRSISVERLWSQLNGAENQPPPPTIRSKNSIVASFAGYRGKASLWTRHDTGETLTERQLRRAGKTERKAVLPVYGMPGAFARGMA